MELWNEESIDVVQLAEPTGRILSGHAIGCHISALSPSQEELGGGSIPSECCCR